MKNKSKIIIIISVVVIILLFICVGLILPRCIYGCKNYSLNIQEINDKVKEEIKNLFVEENTKLVVGLNGQEDIRIKQGTESFGIPIGFSPINTQAWGNNNEGCKYNVQAINQAGYCINQGWDNLREDIITGTSISPFDIVEEGIGYTLIKINVPKEIQPCIQRFSVEVECNIYPEKTKGYFDIQILNKKLF